MAIEDAQPKQGLETGSLKRPSDSKIRQAQPTQGLETGSVQGASGGLGADAKPVRSFADSFEADLSGKNGPESRMDAIMEIVRDEVDSAMRNLQFTSSCDVRIVGAGGRFVVTRRGDASRAFQESESQETSVPWGITPVNFEAGTFKIANGTIIADQSDLTTALTITNGTNTFAASTGQKAYLKVTNLATPACELVVGANWTDYPSAYEITGTGNSAAFTAYHFPLYYFDDSQGDDGIAVATGVYAHRVVESSHFALWFTVAQSAADKSVTVPVLVASHKALPQE